MKRCAGLIAALLAVSLMSGCLDVTSVVAVKKDGTGTITQTTYMGQAMMDMMNQMAMQMGGQMPAGPPPNPFADVNEEELRGKAGDMGEGVTFVSSKQVKKDDGSDGLQVVYAFKDINKLKFGMNPEMPGNAGGGMQRGQKDNPITFSMTKGATPELVVNMPKPEKDANAAGADMDAPPPDAAMQDPQAKAMMKKMFNGFRFRLMLKIIDGEITKTNASFIGVDPTTKKKQYVTLLDMDLGKIVQDDAQLDKLAAMGQIKDMVEAKDKLKDIDGLRIETEEKVTIEIK